MATVLPALGPNFLGGAGGAPALWVKATHFRCQPSWEEAVLRPEVHREKGLRPYFVWSCQKGRRLGVVFTTWKQEWEWGGFI